MNYADKTSRENDSILLNRFPISTTTARACTQYHLPWTDFSFKMIINLLISLNKQEAASLILYALRFKLDLRANN